MQRRFTLYPSDSGEIVAMQEHTPSEQVKRSMRALLRFRGSDYGSIDQVPQDQLPELEAAVMEGKMWWANFCVSDILDADTNKLLAFRSIYREVMGKSHETATGNDMLEATFPKSGNGIPWGHDNYEISDRFPSVKDLLSMKKSWW